MKRLEVRSTVGPDGVLELRLPLGKEDANREVKVTVLPVADSEDARRERKGWRHFLETTAGSIEDPTFKRHDQGHLEDRGDLFR